MKDPADPRYVVPNVMRALEILEVLGDSPEELGVSEVASRLGIPKNSAFRILVTLERAGYLLRNDRSKRYRLSQKLLRLGYAAVDDSSLLEKALPILRELRDATGETTLLGALSDKGGGVVLEELAGKHPVKVLVNVGTRFPLHTAAPAKAILAFLPREERDSLLEDCAFYRFNSHTLAGRAELLSELEQVRERGYSIDRGEEVEGVTCVGAPVFNYRGRPTAAVWVTAPASRLGEGQYERIGTVVAAYGDRISERLGYTHPPRLVRPA